MWQDMSPRAANGHFISRAARESNRVNRSNEVKITTSTWTDTRPSDSALPQGPRHTPLDPPAPESLLRKKFAFVRHTSVIWQYKTLSRVLKSGQNRSRGKAVPG